VTILKVAERIRELTGTSSPIEHCPLPEDDPKVRQPDIFRAKELLGWEPQHDFRDGVERLVGWYRENRGWVKEIETQ